MVIQITTREYPVDNHGGEEEEDLNLLTCFFRLPDRNFKNKLITPETRQDLDFCEPKRGFLGSTGEQRMGMPMTNGPG